MKRLLRRLTAKASFAHARGAGGGASRIRRLSIFNFEKLKGPQRAAFSYLHFLLFPEVCLLCGAAGILAFREPFYGLLALFLIILTDLPRSRDLTRLCCLGAAFVAAFAWAGLREQVAPELPQWLERASALREDARGELRPPLPVRIRALVESSVSLPGGRVRVVLSRIAPADASSPGGEYAGKALWTWNRPEFIPLPGETLELSPRLLPLRGLSNPGLPDHELRMHDQGIWFSARSGGASLAVAGSAHAGLRVPAGEMSRKKSGDAGRKDGTGQENDVGRKNEADRENRTEEDAGLGVSLRLRLSLLREKARDLFYSALPASAEKIATAGNDTKGNDTKGNDTERIAAARKDTERIAAAGNNAEKRGAERTFRPGVGILPALVFGDRSLISPRQADLFAGAGLSHSLALSGMHLTFAVLAGIVCARLAGRVRPSLYLRLPRPRPALLCSLPFALLYLWLGQAPVSLQRAACMLCAAVLFSFMNKPRLILDSLCAALFVLLLRDPFVLFDLSLQLSALCMACIALTLPGILRLSERLFPAGGTEEDRAAPSPAVRLKRGAFILAANSLCIQIVLLPLTLRAFGSAGLLFPLNLLWLPLLQGLILPQSFAALAALCLDFPAAGAALLHLAALPCEGLVELLENLDGAGLMPAPLLPRPHGLSMAAFWLLCLCLPRLFSRGSRHGTAGEGNREGRYGAGYEGNCEAGHEAGRGERRRTLSGADMAVPACALVCLILPFIFLNRPAPGLTLTMPDVGQGQAVLLEWSLPGREGGGRIILDGGGSPNPEFFDPGRRIVAPLLTDNTLPRLTAVINSHPDADHLAGLLWILRHFSVGRVMGNGESPRGSLAVRTRDALRAGALRMETLRAGDIYEPAEDLRLEVLNPPPNGTGTSNNLSLVLRLVWRGRALALICGDAERDVLNRLIEEGRDLSAQVLILPHHGSRNGFAEGFHQVVNPRFALVSCAFANVWGFPARVVRENLKNAGIPLYSTAERGMIRLRWSAPDAEPDLFTTR
ncbi:MAG: ComEC/Rec2 family competence protein [Desulfovibrio sp.]|nr:ComEC/Rec2 family competence protein [Desulfovibrio sp.]